MLDALDVTVEEVRAQVARIVGQGDEVMTGQIPLTPRAKKVSRRTAPSEQSSNGAAERSPGYVPVMTQPRDAFEYSSCNM